MRSGALRHKVIIQAVTQTVDAYGGYTESWSTFATVFAQVSPMKGMEAIEHKKLELENMYRIWIRYISGVTAKMRILWGSRIFQIVGLRVPDERNRSIEITATEEII